MAERILIIDDEPYILATLEEILKLEGYEVESAQSGTAALEKLRPDVYDLVIVDQRMPDMTGLDLLAKIQKIKPPPATILLTAYASVDSAIEALRQGASDYLLKPCHSEELKWSVKQALERKRISAAAQFQRKMEFLYQVGSAIAGETQLDPFLKTLVEKLCEVLELPRCLIFLLTEEGKGLILKGSNVPVDRELWFPVRKGVLYEILSQGKEVVINDPQKDRRLPSLIKRFNLGSLLLVPMILRGHFLGILSVDSGDAPHNFTESEIKLARFVADQAAIGIENIRYWERERDKAREFSLLAEIATAGAQSQNEEAVLNLSIEKGVSLLGADAGTILLIDPQTWNPLDSASSGTPLFSSGSSQPLSPHSIEGVIALSQKPWAISDIQHEKKLKQSERARLKKEGWRSFLGVPIIHKGETKGILSVAMRTQRAFLSKDIALMNSIAHQLALTIENIRLYNLNREHQENLRHLSLKVLSAQEEERKRISRELHDATGQALLALKLHLELLAEQVPLEMTNPQEEIAEAQVITTQAIEEIRRLVADLRPLKLDDLGLIPTLRGLVKDFSRKFNINTTLEKIKLLRRLPSDIETVLYRIVQEALTNVAKHAKATEVFITLERVKDRVEVKVVDDGVGFDAATISKRRARRFGLAGIQERVDLMEGNFRIRSYKGRGTEIWVDIPLAVKPRKSEKGPILMDRGIQREGSSTEATPKKIVRLPRRRE
jgi:signal transduction histidine kinase/DNA-binding NarL/FixJ family response regulator